MRPPKLLVTTCYRPTKVMYQFLADMLEALTNAHYYKRQVCFAAGVTVAVTCGINPVNLCPFFRCITSLSNAGAVCTPSHTGAKNLAHAFWLSDAFLAAASPNSVMLPVQGYQIKKIVEYATERDFTDVLVLNEDRKSINGLLHVHLPGGPTAHYKLSNIVLCKQIKVLMSHTKVLSSILTYRAWGRHCCLFCICRAIRVYWPIEVYSNHSHNFKSI